VKKILISDITNLTDALYFAAANADYLAYNFEKGSNSAVDVAIAKEINEWVEAPGVAIQVGYNFSEEIKKAEELAPTLVIFHPYVNETPTGEFTKVKTAIIEGKDSFEIDYEGFDAVLIDLYTHTIHIEEHLDAINTMASSIPVYIKPLPLSQEVATILNMDNPEGIVLMGSEEEEVGVKSFEEMDEIMDLIEAANETN